MKVKTFAIDINICGTAYIQALDEESARQLVRDELGRPGGHGKGYSLSARPLRLWEVESTCGTVEMSPEFTFYGPPEGAELDCVDEEDHPE